MTSQENKEKNGAALRNVAAESASFDKDRLAVGLLTFCLGLYVHPEIVGNDLQAGAHIPQGSQSRAEDLQAFGLPFKELLSNFQADETMAGSLLNLADSKSPEFQSDCILTLQCMGVI
jgi:hypothetical protein